MSSHPAPGLSTLSSRVLLAAEKTSPGLSGGMKTRGRGVETEAGQKKLLRTGG